PRLTEFTPPVLQRGVESELRVYGFDFGKDAELILPFKAEIRGGGNSDQAATFNIKPAADVPLGVYPVRVRTSDGITNLRLLNLVDVPVVRVKEPNGRYRVGKLDLELVQPIPIPCVIAGQRLERDIDAFRFRVQSGQRLTLVTETWRNGLTPDPLLCLRDGLGRSITYAHDTPTLQRDERLDHTFAKEGDHILEMRSTGGSGWNNHYLAKIGDFDYARSIFPLGGRRGENVAFTITNRDGKASVINARVPADPYSDHWRLPLPDHPGSLPWSLAAGDLPEILEDEKRSEPQKLAWPITVNGRVAKADEEDLYRIAVEPGQRIRVRAEAYHFGSTLDGYLMIYDPIGKKLLAKHDDEVYRGLPDPAIDLEVPAGVREVIVALRDTMNRGGPEYSYRLTVERGGADFLLWMGGKQQPTNEENVGWHRADRSDTLNLTPGQEAKLKLSVRRVKADDPHYAGPVQGYAGVIHVKAVNVPPGVTRWLEVPARRRAPALSLRPADA
ncbi:MAG: hypothetical protein K8T89_18835, partial [Planctomycetes bacterium]|nr:hypothetical protein [Planctomycetota bacterium]